MIVRFKLPKRPAGIALQDCLPGQRVVVQTTELVGPEDPAAVQDRLEQLNGCVFQFIPNLPLPSQVDHLLVVIMPDLAATAYVNELDIRAKVKVTRDVKKGELLRPSDISDLSAVTLGVEIPHNAAVVLFRSLSWRRSIYYDFAPLAIDGASRASDFDASVTTQALVLIGLLPIDATGVSLGSMEAAAMRLRQLLHEGCQEEAMYQELLHENAWMFGGQYTQLERHTQLDDSQIPDFTAVRAADGARDILELKQPFLNCFKQDGTLAAPFNDAWNQAERYLSFVTRQSHYLLTEKGIQISNPGCYLVVGSGWTAEQQAHVTLKTEQSRGVRVITYDQLLRQSDRILELVRTAARGGRGAS